MRSLLTGLFVCFATVSSAQMLPVTVLPDRVTIGGEFIPRCPNVGGNLIVAAGQTKVLGVGDAFNCVETAGALSVSVTASTTLTITTLIVLPGGSFTIGTAAAPIPALVKVTVRIHDLVMDTMVDPFQWSHGIVSFGTFNAFGPFRTPFVLLCADPLVGATSLTLCAAPVGWQPTDELVLDDTAMTIAPAKPRRESTLRITAVMGTTVLLSKPLDFAHVSVLAQNGTLGIRPLVANVTRNIVISSEHPAGVRGHVANVGDAARWNLQGVEFRDLGRTTAAVIDDTSADLSHIGTHPKGRYTLHFHHACHMNTPYACQTHDNVYRGSGATGGKWGMVWHGTHDALSQDDLALDFPGAGFVTEDGYETRDKLVDGLALFNLKPSSTYDDAIISARNNLDNNQPGIEGAGGWFHGIQNYFTRFQARNNTIGMNLFDFKGKPGLFPSMPGGMPDTPFATPYTNDGPFKEVVGLVTVGNVVTGLETWGLKDAGMTGLEANLPIIDGLRSVNDYIGTAHQQAEAFHMVYLKNPTIIQSYPLGNGQPVDTITIYYGGACVHLSTGYVSPFKLTGGYLSGCASAIYGVPNGLYLVSDTTLQGAVGLNVDIQAVPSDFTTLTFTNVKFLPYGNHPPRYVVIVHDTIWDGTGPFPLGGTVPPPPPPPPPVWVTLPGIFQQQQSPNPALFRLCPDASGMGCQLFVKP